MFMILSTRLSDVSDASSQALCTGIWPGKDTETLGLDLIRSRLAAARDCLSKPHVRPELKQHNMQFETMVMISNDNRNEYKMVTNIDKNHLHTVC